MRVYVDTNHMFDGLDGGFWLAMVLALVILIGAPLLIINWLKKKEEAKPVEKGKGKLLEVIDESSSNNLAPLRFYIFECEDGSRIRLKRLQSNPLNVIVGDVCVFSYRKEYLVDVSDINA